MQDKTLWEEETSVERHSRDTEAFPSSQPTATTHYSDMIPRRQQNPWNGKKKLWTKTKTDSNIYSLNYAKPWCLETNVTHNYSYRRQYASPRTLKLHYSKMWGEKKEAKWSLREVITCNTEKFHYVEVLRGKFK